MGVLAALLPMLGPILDRTLGALIPDPAARQKAVQDMLGQLMQADLSQIQVNTAEAGHRSIFVAGWRPMVGWCCAMAVLYTYLLVPIGMWASYALGHPIPKPPGLDDNLWELLFGMLGMGALRSVEKIKRVAK